MDVLFAIIGWTFINAFIGCVVGHLRGTGKGAGLILGFLLGPLGWILMMFEGGPAIGFGLCVIAVVVGGIAIGFVVNDMPAGAPDPTKGDARRQAILAQAAIEGHPRTAPADDAEPPMFQPTAATPTPAPIVQRRTPTPQELSAAAQQRAAEIARKYAR